MIAVPVQKDGFCYIACAPESLPVASEADALELVAACGEAGTDRLLLLEENLGEDFFHLSTCLAGLVLQKLDNYRIRAALVIAKERMQRGKFHEFVLETNRGSQFHFCEDRAQAEAWLKQP